MSFVCVLKPHKLYDIQHLILTLLLFMIIYIDSHLNIVGKYINRVINPKYFSIIFNQ